MMGRLGTIFRKKEKKRKESIKLKSYLGAKNVEKVLLITFA